MVKANRFVVILALFLSVFSISTHAQRLESIQFQWVRSLPGEGSKMIADDQENMYVAGKDFLLAKYNAAGNAQFVKGVNALNDSTLSYDIALDASQHIYLVGTYKDSFDLAPEEDFPDNRDKLPAVENPTGFLAKYDSNGNFLWGLSFPASRSIARCIELDSEGNLHVSGTFWGNMQVNDQVSLQSRGDRDIFMLKFDPEGGLIHHVSIGGAGYEDATDMHISQDDIITLTGFYSSAADFDPGEEVVALPTFGIEQGRVFEHQFIVQYNTAKQLVAHNYVEEGVLNTNPYTRNALHIFRDPENNFYYAGTEMTVPSISVSRSFFSKYNAQFDRIYRYDLPYLGTNISIANFLSDQAGNTYAAGNVMVTRDFAFDFENPLYIGADFSNPTTTTYLVKYDQDGKLLEGFGIEDARATDLYLDNQEHIYMMGGGFASQGPPDFDPTENTALLAGPYIAKYAQISCENSTVSIDNEALICTSANPEVRTFGTSLLDVQLGENYAFAITDESDQVVAVPTGNSYDMSALEPGTYRVYGISFQGMLQLRVNENISTSFAEMVCAELSSNFASVVVANPPSISITQTVDASCGQPNGLLTASAEGTGALSYRWDTGVEAPQLTDLLPGTYTVTVTDANGCQASTMGTVGDEGSRLPIPAFTWVQDELTVTFTDNTPHAPTQWEWEWGEGNTSTVANPTHTYDLPGTYTVTLTTANACGSASTSQEITVDVECNLMLTTSSTLLLVAFPMEVRPSFPQEAKPLIASVGAMIRPVLLPRICLLESMRSLWRIAMGVRSARK